MQRIYSESLYSAMYILTLIEKCGGKTRRCASSGQITHEATHRREHILYKFTDICHTFVHNQPKHNTVNHIHNDIPNNTSCYAPARVKKEIYGARACQRSIYVYQQQQQKHTNTDRQQTHTQTKQKHIFKSMNTIATICDDMTIRKGWCALSCQLSHPVWHVQIPTPHVR